MATKVLVVEDDISLQTALTRALKSSEFHVEVDWVTTAEEAIKRLGENKFDKTQKHYELIISDIFLSGKANGLDLWQKCETCLPHVPVLLMSGMEIQDFFNSVGRNVIAPPFLSKPFSLKEFKQITEGLLQTARRHQFVA